VLVPNRAAGTLEAAVQQYVLPGTELWTDMWKGYSSLESMLCKMTLIQTDNNTGIKQHVYLPKQHIINNQQLSFFCLQLISVINIYIFSYAVKLTFFSIAKSCKCISALSKPISGQTFNS